MSTALHAAALRGDVAAATALLSSGAAPLLDAQDPQGRTALHGAVLGSQLALARLLLEAGCSLDVADAKGMTPLSYASGKGDAASVRLLLEHGAATGPASSSGPSPLEVAVVRGQREVAALRQRLGEGGKSDIGIGDVYENLESMEAIMMSSDEIGNRNLDRLRRAHHLSHPPRTGVIGHVRRRRGRRVRGRERRRRRRTGSAQHGDRSPRARTAR